MQYLSTSQTSGTGSPPRKSPPLEQTDEARRLIENDQVDVERGIPTDHDEPIEGAEPHQRPDPPVFED